MFLVKWVYIRCGRIDMDISCSIVTTFEDAVTLCESVKNSDVLMVTTEIIMALVS